jgi:hypothetical protein
MSNKFYNKILEQNPKLGFYTVGQTKYYSKIQALLEATKINQFPHWNFNNEIYGSQLWTEEPESNLKQLYYIRAQQLRDTYDYIRVEASGGGDSTTVIFSFLLNGLHIDEIIFRYPSSGDKNLTPDPFNFRSENHLSEYEYATKPLLNWVKTNYPRVKITVHDYSADMLKNPMTDDLWISSSKDFLQPAHVVKFTNYQTVEQSILADTGKKLCILYGIDKPKLCIRDGKWYAYFVDFQANYANPDMGDYTNITNEYFFWSPDLPEIVIKQVHSIKNWFDRSDNRHLQHLATWPNHSMSQRTAYEHIIKPLIYPDYDPTTFQVGKPGSNFYSEMDQWFYKNFANHQLYQIWQAGIKFAETHIDDKYFNKEFNRKIGFVGFLSPFYYVGEVESSVTEYLKITSNVYDRF